MVPACLFMAALGEDCWGRPMNGKAEYFTLMNKKVLRKTFLCLGAMSPLGMN